MRDDTEYLGKWASFILMRIDYLYVIKTVLSVGKITL